MVACHSLGSMGVKKDCFYGVKFELEQIAEMLQNRGWMLGTAESCTGGKVSAVCTAMAGSSAWFEGGIVSYANAVKESLLQVDSALIARHGAVSQEVAEAMALGALDSLGVDVAVAITGIAGPSGGTVDKPVGTVWVAVGLRHPDCATLSKCFCFQGDREAIRVGASQAAFYLILQALTT